MLKYKPLSFLTTFKESYAFFNSVLRNIENLSTLLHLLTKFQYSAIGNHFELQNSPGQNVKRTNIYQPKATAAIHTC